MPMRILLLTVLVVLGAAWGWHRFQVTPAPLQPSRSVASPLPDTTAAPVVLELFTSQGCSSCPPADRLLSELGRRYGEAVIPLSFHVDYWNDLGWADPFSREAWSARQARYAGQLKDGGVYTPQLVLQGQTALVGSHATRVRQQLDALRTQPLGTRVILTPTPGSAGTRALTVHVEVLRSLPARTLDVVVVVFENGLVTNVVRGENARRQLRNDYVVRHLEPAGTLAATLGTTHTASLVLPGDGLPTNGGAVAIVQDPATGQIHGAARWTANPAAEGDHTLQN